MEGKDSSPDVLRKEIREQSEVEAASLLEQAEKEAQTIVRAAETEAEKVRAGILRKAEAQAEGVRKRILSGVQLEIRRQTLRTREEVLTKIFSAVEEKWTAFRQAKAYLEFLKKLVVEGVLALDSDGVEILAGDVERELLTKKTLSELEEEIREKQGKKVKLGLSDQTLSESGVVLVASDGRTQFDNRFSARIERMQDEMRLVAMKGLEE